MVVLTTHRRAIFLLSLTLLVAACSGEAAKRQHFDNGNRLLQDNKPGEAIVEFKNAIERDEAWGEARFMLAEAYAKNGEPESAYKQYIRAADLMPDDAGVQVKAARYLSIAGQHQDARARAQKVLEKHPTNIDAQIALANALAGLSDLEGAVAQISEAIQLEPARSDTYSNLALVRVAQGRHDDARAAFEKAVEMDDTSVPARLALANFQWSSGDVAKAEGSLRRAFTIDPKHVLANRALATFFLASGRPAEAEPYLRSAAEIANTRDATLNLADYYITYGRVDQARRILEPLAGHDTDKAAIETRLASIEYAEGRPADGHRRLDTVLGHDPNNATALLQKARWLLAEGRPEQALERAQSAVAISPRSIAAYYLRAEAEARTHRTTNAIKSFSEVLRLNPQAVDAQVQLSRLHLAHNTIESAVLFAEEALANAPDNLEARLALIRAWIARSDVKRAETELGTLKQRFPAAAGVYTVEGLLRMGAGDMPGARAAFERALQLDATSDEALAGITSIDVLRGDTKVARARLDQRLSARPDNPDLLLLSAKVALAANDHAGAERALRRSIDVDPLETSNFALLARLFSEQKRLDAATKEFDEASEREPSNIATRMMSAVLLHAQGKLTDAKSRYEAILKKEPRAALAANNLASIYAEQGENLDYAQQLAEAASELLPAHAEVRDTLGWIYYRRQMPGLAIRQFLQSIAAEPNNAVYHYHLGLAYARNHEPDRAREAFRRALTLNPRLTDAKKALASLDVSS